MIMRRLRQLSLLLFSFLICGMAFFQLFARTGNTIPTNFAVLLGLVVALSLVFWGLVLHFLPYASQVIQPCVLLLTGLGTVMIARIDHEHDTEVATRQLMFVCLAIVLSSILIVAMRDYRILRRFSYVSMVVGLVLLLSPMLPVLGQNINGARIWIRIPGLGSLQPGEFAKLFLAFFFAAYL